MIAVLVLLSATVPIVDPVCVSLSRTVKSGFYLQNNLFGVVKKPSLFDCAASCQAHIECLSFGFEPRKRLCHLHFVEEKDVPHELVPVNHWIHGDLYDLPLDLWGPCVHHNCTAGQKCTTNRVTKQAVCVKGDIELCPVPSHLENANISSGGRKLGEKRMYTCLEDYLDISSSLMSSVSTCLPDFTWSHSNLTCSGPYATKVVKTTASTIFVRILQGDVLRDVVKDSSLVFFCKSCSNCQVKLLFDSDIKYVTIGISMTAVSIDEFEKPASTIQAVDTLSCSEFRPFWINWINGTVAVGNGTIVGSQEYNNVGPLSLGEIVRIKMETIGAGNNATLLFLKQNAEE